MSPLAGLAVLSLGTAVAVLLAFKWTADQRALVASKRAMQAAIFEMRLFNDDLAGDASGARRGLATHARYLRLSLAPTLWLIVPMLALLLHMEFHFGYTGLTIGEAALVKVRFAEAAPPASLEAPDAVGVETPGVLLPSEREIVWRIRPRASGSYELRVDVGGTVLSKTLLVSDAVARRSPVRPGTDLVNQLLYPSESPLPSGMGLSRDHDCLSPARLPRRRLEHRLVGRLPGADAGVCAGAETAVRRGDVNRRTTVATRRSPRLRPGFRLRHRHHLVRRDVLEDLRYAARPRDLNPGHLADIPQAEVHAEIAR